MARLCEVRIGIGQPREVGGARPGAEITQERVAVRLPTPRVHLRVGIVKVAEPDRLRRACGLAGRDRLAVLDAAVLLLGGTAGAADALDAIGALFHDPAGAHRYVGIEPRLDDRGAEPG